MATNIESWTKPTFGRLTESGDYVGKNGFGHEDWNFAKDIWNDGQYHLHLQGSPAQADRSKLFNIALGALTKYGHVVVGFCENVRYMTSALDEEIWQRRAEQLEELEAAGELGGYLSGLSAKDKVNVLKSDSDIYDVAVNPKNLLVLDTPVLVPQDIIKPSYHRYQLRKLDRSQYQQLKSLIIKDLTLENENEECFPEGKLIESIHRKRERNSKVVTEAKADFIRKHGSLYCEACGWRPELPFPDSKLKNAIIEAHHDIPLSSPEHGGATRKEDLKMLCPNCHRVIHKMRPWLRTHELKAKFFDT